VIHLRAVSRLASLGALVVGLGFANNALAAPRRTSLGSRSIRAPNSGQLEAADRLTGSSALWPRAGAHPFGTIDLVRLLHRAANQVARKFRGSTLLVGDLSARQGGKLAGHRSHQSGRDADVGFYLESDRGRPVRLRHFVPFDAEGRARSGPAVHFDDARNWAFVQALLEDRWIEVRYIFVAHALKMRLLKTAEEHRASKELIHRASLVLMTPAGAPHDDHFHIRIACPASSKGVCTEESLRGVKTRPTEVASAHATRPRIAKAPQADSTAPVPLSSATDGAQPVEAPEPANAPTDPEGSVEDGD
jgi:penicillin-insensitive murein endopeptidase